MAKYLASQIILQKLKYNTVIVKYVKYKTAIDEYIDVKGWMIDGDGNCVPKE